MVYNMDYIESYMGDSVTYIVGPFIICIKEYQDSTICKIFQTYEIGEIEGTNEKDALIKAMAYTANKCMSYIDRLAAAIEQGKNLSEDELRDAYDYDQDR